MVDTRIAKREMCTTMFCANLREQDVNVRHCVRNTGRESSHFTLKTNTRNCKGISREAVECGKKLSKLPGTNSSFHAAIILRLYIPFWKDKLTERGQRLHKKDFCVKRVLLGSETTDKRHNTKSGAFLLQI